MNAAFRPFAIGPPQPLAAKKIPPSLLEKEGGSKGKMSKQKRN
jgi:hypothetical protein